MVPWYSFYKVFIVKLNIIYILKCNSEGWELIRFWIRIDAVKPIPSLVFISEC